MRVVSVLPSATEIVCRLGASEELVGRSAECDYPERVRSLPVVMRPTSLDTERPSSEIDARVRASLEEGASLYELDLEVLRALRPDLLLTQDLCRVCSVTDDEVRSACRTAGVAPRIVALTPRNLPEVEASLAQVGAALGRDVEAERLRTELVERARMPAPRHPGRVAVLEWVEPTIEAGLWTPDLIRAAGGTPWSSDSGGRAQVVDLAALERDPPELAIVSPCSFSVDRTLRELRTSPVGRRLRALRLPQGVWVADEAFFSRPGPRLIEGAELVHRLLDGRDPFEGDRVVAWSLPIAGGRG
jgi:iron complex transport system substrate-binding protein